MDSNTRPEDKRERMEETLGTLSSYSGVLEPITQNPL